ncbi:lipocalin family protein [uncultured Prevotella sp.]|uniref:lipocalin family protein n=1 Tax=uncultured Prevotella sp. TaxID=159272 RepID=UPI00258818D1|nr:lipocalin family protein [uncultured Prevotella sp.]
MKQLKIWSMMMLMVMVMPLVMACSSDDGDDDGARDEKLVAEAVGSWMCIQSTDSQGSNSINGLMVGKEVTIKKDGTFTSTAPSFGSSGTYTVSGNKITARSNAGTFVITVSISGDKMTWSGTASNGVTFRYVFQKEV